LTPQFEAYARGAVSFDRQADIFSQCEVCLNFSNVWADGRPGSVLIPHVRLRDFEVPMCRSCYLTGHSDEIEEFYDIGREIETYRTKEELVSKVRFYLANQRAAEQLREAGYRRARRDHTWVRRFDQLFQAIGVGARS
jgi:spore maturation protein CgeB